MLKPLLKFNLEGTQGILFLFFFSYYHSICFCFLCNLSTHMPCPLPCVCSFIHTCHVRRLNISETLSLIPLFISAEKLVLQHPRGINVSPLASIHIYRIFWVTQALCEIQIPVFIVHECCWPRKQRARNTFSEILSLISMTHRPTFTSLLNRGLCVIWK